jgi:hypothetical protein
MLGGTGAPNPLFEVITIHDYEESSEVSSITSIPITEEKEPKKASTPSLDALFQDLP